MEFDILASCWFESQPKFQRDPEAQELARDYLVQLRNAFDEGHGGGTRFFYYGTSAEIALALTEDQGLHFVCNLDEESSAVHEIIRRCQDAVREARQYLKETPDELNMITERLYQVAADALFTLDNEEGKGPTGIVLTALRDELREALDAYAGLVGRTAQRYYLSGLGLGTVAVGLVLLCLGLLAEGHSLAGLRLAGLICGSTGGVLGAGLSVLTRLTHGKLAVDHRPRQFLVTFFGAARPLIGAIFGVAAYFFTSASLIQQQSGAAVPLWFAVGFAAGFFERLTQDMLTSPISGTSGSA